jgi:hypothetical protein
MEYQALGISVIPPLSLSLPLSNAFVTAFLVCACHTFPRAGTGERVNDSAHTEQRPNGRKYILSSVVTVTDLFLRSDGHFFHPAPAVLRPP